MGSYQSESHARIPAAGTLPPSRRSDHRYDVHLDVDLTLEGQHYSSTTRTLSLGGAFIESQLRPAFNTRVRLCFAVPYRSEPIDVTGTVRWSDACGFGVQFDGLRAHAVWALGKFFEQQ